MDAGDIVRGIGLAAFCRGATGEISAWNEAAEAMLGHSAVGVIGKRCHEVIRGRDELGAYCCDRCPSWQAAVRGAAIQPHRMEVRDARGQRVDVAVVVLQLSNGGLSLIHLLERVEATETPDSCWEAVEVDVSEPCAVHGARPAELTFRELDIMHQLALGHDSSAIATRLLLTRAKVWVEISSCIRKLQSRG